MNFYSRPISEEGLAEIVKPWGNLIAHCESGSFYYYSKSDLMYRLMWLDKYPKIIIQYVPNVHLKIVDLENYDLDDEIDCKVLFQCKSPRKKTAFIVLGLEHKLEHEHIALLNGLEIFHHANQHIPLLFFFHTDFLNLPIYRKISPHPLFLKNIHFHPLHKAEDVKHFINYQMIEWNMSINNRTQNRIFKYSGGNLWIARELIRIVRKNKILPSSFPELWKFESFRIKIEYLWNSFSVAEKETFVRLVQTNEADKKSREYRFLSDTGWTSGKNKCSISVEALTEYIQQNVLRNKLEVDAVGRVHMTRYSKENIFSRQHARLLKLFLTNKYKVVSRDAVAQAIWPDMWNEKYSDWAIDQAVSRLKKKLKEIHADQYRLLTLKKVGFKLLTSND